MGKVLVVDDEASLRELLGLLIRKAGHQVEVASNGQVGIELLRQEEFDVVFTDLRMPGELSGLDVLRHVRDHVPSTQIVMMTAFATTETAIQAMKLGAYDYIEKPFKIEEVEVVLQKCLEKRALLQENVQLKSELQSRYNFGNLLGKSAAMQELFGMLRKITDANVSVLILGENGTGKELVARALHYNSQRTGPFVPINCGAIPEALLESELFGYERGAFSGADRSKTGLFVSAEKGTVFLDEIGDMPLAMQVKLLRVLQEKQVRPVGGTQSVSLNVRIVAATNKKLAEEVKAGRFREDLFFRLNVFSVEMPTLRERREDIPMLAKHFLEQMCREQGRTITDLSPQAMKVLMEYGWPGNVRELKNTMEYAVLMEASSLLQPESLPSSLRKEKPSELVEKKVPTSVLPSEGLEPFLEKIERDMLRLALKQANGVRKEAAKLLDISFRSFRYRLAKHDHLVKELEQGKFSADKVA